MLAMTLLAALLTGQAADAPLAEPAPEPLGPPVESMSVGELKAEYVRLEQARPGIGGPITLMAIGGGAMAYGGLFLLVSGGSGGTGSLFTTSSPLGYIFVGMLMAGAGMLFPGIWMLWNRRLERAEYGQRMDDINERLGTLDQVDAEAREKRDRFRTPAPPPQGYPQL